jgi:hypothetical protein
MVAGDTPVANRDHRSANPPLRDGPAEAGEEEDRQWWLERFTLDEIRQMAARSARELERFAPAGSSEWIPVGQS